MNRLIAIGLVVLALAAAARSMLFVVDQRESAVVFALGEIKRVIKEPGLHWKLPPPFQNVRYFDKRTLTLDNSDIDRFITSEKLNIQVDSYVKWRIADPRLFFVSVGGNELLAQDRISRQLRAALNNEIARMTVDEVISLKRDQLVITVRSEVAEELIKIGVEIVDVRLKRVDFAPEVAERVYERMQSERKRVANERRATGSAEKEKIQADADRERVTVLATAYKQAQEIKGLGDANASKAYAEAFGKNPEFASFYRSLEAYRNSFDGRSDVLVLDPSADFFRYFNSPQPGLPGAPRGGVPAQAAGR
ncbi:MAG: protease modulator HflC [Lautropia sp.]